MSSRSRRLRDLEEVAYGLSLQHNCGERMTEEQFAPFPLLIPFGPALSFASWPSTKYNILVAIMLLFSYHFHLSRLAALTVPLPRWEGCLKLCNKLLLLFLLSLLSLLVSSSSSSSSSLSSSWSSFDFVFCCCSTLGCEVF